MLKLPILTVLVTLGSLTTPNAQSEDAKRIIDNMERSRQQQALFLEFRLPGTELPTFDETVEELFVGLSIAKNATEIMAVRNYCTASIVANSFEERDGLSLQALQSLKRKKIDEANAALMQIDVLMSEDRKLAEKVCWSNRK